MAEDLAKTLAAFAHASVADTAALDVMELSLFDWAACGIAGREQPVARIVRDMVLGEGGQGPATLFGGGKAPPRAAALANGTISHALDYDDTHFAHIGHPSVAVVPAVIALCEAEGLSWTEALPACLVGAEASIRVGMWLGRGHYQIGFHQTATAGAFGATLAACRVLGLGEAQTAQALGLVATRTSGLKSQFGTMGKPFNAGLAASNGVEAALLARAGFASNPMAMEGPQGFGPTHHGADARAAFEELGAHWIFETVSHKYHACCHGLHAMLEALMAVRVPVGTIERVEVSTHPRWLSVCNILAPRTGLEAKFSYKRTAAMALAGVDTAAMESFDDAVVTRGDLVSLSERVAVLEDARLPETASKVRVIAEGAHVATHDLAAPMEASTRREKLQRKVRALLGDADADALGEAVWGRDLAALTALMRG